MAIKQFLTSVADVVAYDDNDSIVFTSKTLLNSNIEVTTGNQEVRGGRGNQLLFNYYNTTAMTVTLEETQFNLAMLGSTVGSDVSTGSDIYTSETVTLGSGGTGTVTGTPLALPNSGVIYGWVELPGGTTEKVTFTGSNFTASGGVSGDICCVTYYVLNSAARSITIPANVIPKIVRLVMKAQLNSSDVTANKIGSVEIIIPRFSLSGAFTLSLASNGVSNTPLSGMAFAYSDAESASCTSETIYAKIIEILDDATWYENVVALAIQGGDFTLASTLATKTLVVYAVKDNGDAPFIVDNADLSFTSSVPGKATAGLHTGLITGVSAGTTLITAVITNKTSIEASATATVPA